MLFAPPIKISGYAPDLSEIVLAQAIVYSKENLSFVVVLLSASSWFVFLWYPNFWHMSVFLEE